MNASPIGHKLVGELMTIHCISVLNKFLLKPKESYLVAKIILLHKLAVAESFIPALDYLSARTVLHSSQKIN